MTTDTKSNAGDAFDPRAQGGVERPDGFGYAWPQAKTPENGGIAGKVKGYQTFRSKMNGEDVTVCLLEDAVVYTPDGGKGTLVAVGPAGVIVGAGLRSRVGDAVLPRGSYVSIRFLGVDPELRNMRKYGVYDVTEGYLMSLLKACGKVPGQVPVASAETADDLPF